MFATFGFVFFFSVLKCFLPEGQNENYFILLFSRCLLLWNEEKQSENEKSTKGEGKIFFFFPQRKQFFFHPKHNSIVAHQTASSYSSFLWSELTMIKLVRAPKCYGSIHFTQTPMIKKRIFPPERSLFNTKPENLSNDHKNCWLIENTEAMGCNAKGKKNVYKLLYKCAASTLSIYSPLLNMCDKLFVSNSPDFEMNMKHRHSSTQ